jgi:hypothetical protein
MESTGGAGGSITWIQEPKKLQVPICCICCRVPAAYIAAYTAAWGKQLQTLLLGRGNRGHVALLIRVVIWYY